jgi:hypothetical protein
MSTPEKGQQTLSQLRTLLQSLADQLDDSDEDRTAMSREAHGKMVPTYVVAQNASEDDKERAAEIITQVLGVRLGSIRSALETIDGLSDELALGPLVDFKQIRFPGLEELISGAEA